MKMRSALAIAAGVHALAGGLLLRAWPKHERVVEVQPEVTWQPVPVPEPAPEGGGGGGGGNKPRRKMAVQVIAHETGDAPAIAPAIADEGGGETGPAPGAGTGTGSGIGAGSGPATVAPSAPVVDRSKILKAALEKIRAARHYPELARRRGLEGVVTVAFRVLPDGAVTELRVQRAAAPALDEAALEAVRRAAPLPSGLAGPVEVDLDFRLSE